MKARVKALLKRLERFVRTDVTYLARGGLWVSLGQLVAMASSLVMAIVFANVLSKETLGIYQFILSLVGFVSIFSLTGLGTALLRAVAQGRRGTLRQAVRTHLVWSLPMLLIAYAIAAYYYLNDNLTLSLSFLIGGTMMPVIKTYALYVPYLEGKKQFAHQTHLSIYKTVVPAAAILTTVFFFSQDPLVLSATYFIASGITIYLLYQWTVHQNRAVAPREDPEMVNYAKHLSLMSVLGKSLSYVERILLFQFAGPVALAQFHFASLVPAQLGEADRVIKKLVLPKLSQRDLPTLKRTLPRKVFLFFLCMLALVIAYILAAPHLFALLFPDYTNVVLYSQVYSLVLLAVPFGVFSKALTAHMKKRQLYIQKTVLPILMLTLFLLLIPGYGIWGIIAARLITRAVGSGVVTYQFIRA